jgi:hypothetical protein
MARTGPVTKDSTTIALGLAQIRVKAYAAYIGQVGPALAAADSIGALANTSFTSTAEYFRLESGYPLLEDATFPLRENAMLECAFREITPANFALAKGKDPANYSSVHYGSVPLGGIVTPVRLRVEAVYTYPDGTNTMTIIFPRAQAAAVIEMEFAEEEPSAIAVSLESKQAGSDNSEGHVIWDNQPLGRVLWNDGSTLTTTSSTTTTTTA